MPTLDLVLEDDEICCHFTSDFRHDIDEVMQVLFQPGRRFSFVRPGPLTDVQAGYTERALTREGTQQ